MAELLTGVPTGVDWMHTPGPMPLQEAGRGARLAWARRLEAGSLGQGALVGFAALVTRGPTAAPGRVAWDAYRDLAARVRASALRRGREAMGLGAAGLGFGLLGGDEDEAEDLDMLVRGVPDRDPEVSRAARERLEARAELVQLLFPDIDAGPVQTVLGGAPTEAPTPTPERPRPPVAPERPTRPTVGRPSLAGVRPAVATLRPGLLRVQPAASLHLAEAVLATADARLHPSAALPVTGTRSAMARPSVLLDAEIPARIAAAAVGREEIVGTTVRYWSGADLGRGGAGRLRVNVGRAAGMVQLGGGLQVRAALEGRPRIGGGAVAARDADGRVQIWTRPDQPPTEPGPRLPAAVGEPALWTSARGRHLAFRDAEGAVHVVREEGGRWSPVRVDAPPAAGDPAGWGDARLDQVVYRGTDGRLHGLAGSGARWRSSPLDSRAEAGGDPHVYASPEGAVVVFRDPAGRVHALRQDPRGRWAASTLPIAVPAAGDPAGAFWPADPTHHVVYRGVDGRLHEVWRRADGRWRAGILSDKVAAAAPAGDPSVAAGADGALHVVYRGVDGHLHALALRSGDGWTHADVTRLTGVRADADPSLAATGDGLQLAASDGSGGVTLVTLDRAGRFAGTALWGTR